MRALGALSKRVGQGEPKAELAPGSTVSMATSCQTQ